MTRTVGLSPINGWIFEIVDLGPSMPRLLTQSTTSSLFQEIISEHEPFNSAEDGISMKEKMEQVSSHLVQLTTRCTN